MLMLSIEHCIALYKAGKLADETGGMILSILRWFKKRRLTDAEKDILQAAATTGTVQLVKIEGYFHVVANSHGFSTPTDLPNRLKYGDAFERLCEKCFIQPVDNEGMFSITSAGLKWAKK
jgi:hypothetical protein